MPQPANRTPPGAPCARLFLALCPGVTEQAALTTHAAAWQWPAGAARYAPADWHVTLHFLGALPLSRLAELRAALAVPLTPFELRFGQAELWPHGLAVLLPLSVPQALQQLHARLEQALQGLGLTTDTRPYRPHLTLARHAAQALPPALAPVFSWHVPGYALMASTGQPGPRYRVLQHYGAAR